MRCDRKKYVGTEYPGFIEWSKAAKTVIIIKLLEVYTPSLILDTIYLALTGAD